MAIHSAMIHGRPAIARMPRLSQFGDHRRKFCRQRLDFHQKIVTCNISIERPDQGQQRWQFSQKYQPKGQSLPSGRQFPSGVEPRTAFVQGTAKLLLLRHLQRGLGPCGQICPGLNAAAGSKLARSARIAFSRQCSPTSSRMKLVVGSLRVSGVALRMFSYASTCRALSATSSDPRVDPLPPSHVPRFTS